MNVAGFVGVTDEELVVRAMRDAQSLIAEHIERGPFDAEQAITELMEVLDRQDVVAATDRLCNQFGLRPSRSR
jgi:L-lactate utilization protein LutC